MINLTPKKYQNCIAGIGCPAVYATERGTLLLVGRRVRRNDPLVVDVVSAADDEEIVEIPVDLLSELPTVKTDGE